MSRFNEYVRELALQKTHGFCSVEGCLKRAEEIHHGLANTKSNNKKYPLFMQSVFNAFPICKDHHIGYTQHPEVRVKDHVAAVYEEYLTKLKGEL